MFERGATMSHPVRRPGFAVTPPDDDGDMSTSTTELPTRRAHTVPTHPDLRRHRREVARWALAHGHKLHRDALAVIVGTRSDNTLGTVSLTWTSNGVGIVLWSGAASWCARNGADIPTDLAATLGTYLRYLSGHRLLDEGSDSVGSLRRAIAEYQLPDRDSRSRHPAAGARRNAPVLPIC